MSIIEIQGLLLCLNLFNTVKRVQVSRPFVVSTRLADIIQKTYQMEKIQRPSVLGLA